MVRGRRGDLGRVRDGKRGFELTCKLPLAVPPPNGSPAVVAEVAEEEATVEEGVEVMVWRG